MRDLHFAIGAHVIYDGVDVDIARGRITAIMGPSGTGKTTLLRLISGQWRAARGSVRFDGAEVARMSQRELFEQRKRMGMLFQSGALLTDLSVYDNVAFPLREHTRLPERLIRDIVLMKLEAVGLRGARGLYPAQLSGGMARRVALARAIALDPEMIMYDEPFAGQDPISMGVLLRLIRRLNDVLGLTAIVVSHDVKETLGIADYVYVISDATVIDHGTPDDIRNSRSDWVQQFIHAEADGPVPFHYHGAPYADELLTGERG
ncbi:toluene ABC transporter ATP-binding protein [Salinisphaera orenii MK-B5]|uniref:Toluene ABC transporter ATP-binding protein n=2 Tax=Salinisphaera orenii TaxID=856731 RepID=A0A423PNE6_9GAMM|nr:toluene ABC transporter ATP-binding protein [Salinisphaera halophila YIM 95161]ROO27145.1 toluene ABC transporter ATP-binding protein [Salinisphaera orenii MK-B5]